MAGKAGRLWMGTAAERAKPHWEGTLDRESLGEADREGCDQKVCAEQ